MGGENRSFIENFIVDIAGIYEPDRAEIVTVWTVDCPAHVIVRAREGDKLEQDIAGIIGNFRTEADTSSLHACPTGNCTTILDP